MRLFGVVMERDVPGVVWDGMAQLGAFTDRMLNFDEQHIRSQIEHRDPGLLVFQFGGNDLQLKDSKIEWFKARFTEVLIRFRGEDEQSPCLVISPVDHGMRSGGRIRSVPTVAGVTSARETTTGTACTARAVVLGSYLSEDDASGRTMLVRAGETFEIGRKPGSAFADDPYVDRYHAALVARPEGVSVEDFGSKNGIFVRVQGSTPLPEHALIRVGQGLLRFTPLSVPLERKQEARPLGCHNPGYWARIDAMLTPEVVAASVPLDTEAARVGVEDADVEFPDDPFVEPRHCTIETTAQGTVLVDCGSVWGTWVQVGTGDTIPYGSEVLIGSTRLRIDPT